MASIESDDDDFLSFSQEEVLPSPRKSLKRLKKTCERKSRFMYEHNSSSDSEFCDKPAEIPPRLLMESGFHDSATVDNILTNSNPQEEADSDSKSDEISPDKEQEDHADTLDAEERNDGDKGATDDIDSEDFLGSESDEEVDEDDEVAVLNLLEKRRKSPPGAVANGASLELPPLDEQEVTEKPLKKKKIKSAEMEEMHATSQRLLRETPHASFKPHVSTGKSITSVLEKIRLRKLQLVQGWKHTSSPSVQQPQDIEEKNEDVDSSKISLSHAEDAMDVENVFSQDDEGQETLPSIVPTNVEGDVNTVNTPERNAERCKIDDIEKTTFLKSEQAFRAPMEDTQDLLSPSQSSHEDLDENPNLGTEEDGPLSGSGVNLHFDTETQDDFEHWLDEEEDKENLEPTTSLPAQVVKGPSVRALIDDEAEDEDEDILVPGDDEEMDYGEDLKDMLVEETNEKERDREKRAELHRKWLEQQDAVMTDDILLRLKTGWRPCESRKRGLECLNDELDLFTKKDMDKQHDSLESESDWQEFPELPFERNSLDVEASGDANNPDEARTFKPLEDLNDVHESSDDEEAEQRMLRQRFLQESEQGDLMSPADDETSREVFVLINKVNIATANKKLKQGSINDLRYLGRGSSNSNSSFGSKSSFLRRTGSSTFGSVQRPGSSNSGSGTRSFIFGRDDSNSSHSFDQQPVDVREMKENLEPTCQAQGTRKESTEATQIGRRARNCLTSSVTRLGPSLFEILRRQSTDLDHSLQKRSDGGGLMVSPLLSAFKPIKSTNTPRVGRSRAL